jgi:hypothetical protein
LLGRLTRIAVEAVLAFYAARAEEEVGPGAKSGVITAVQRTSSDLRLNPHLHMIALDGTWREKDGELAWEGLGHLRTSEVGEVLERLVRRLGVLAPASPWGSRLAPQLPEAADAGDKADRPAHGLSPVVGTSCPNVLG